ncbi:MAG: PAS domain S-box protein, partial [Methanothrix sp.]|nr:PAS domain S-box protein [Methanothrix sp.]
MTMSNEDLLAENEDLRRSLDEAQEILHAIRSGEVDALVLSRPEGEQVFTLEGADRAYRVLIEAMNEGAITMAADGTILFCNRYFADMVKSPQEKVIGSSFYRFISQADRAAFKMLQQGLGRDELILRADDETILPVYISINFLKLSESQEAFCVIVTDLIDQKRKEEIVAAEKLARSIIEQTTEAVVVCDKDGKITRFSNAASKIVGCDPTLKSFEVLFDLQHPIAKKLSPVSAALRGEVLLQVEASFKRSDSTLLHLLLNAGPLTSEDGKIIGCVVTLTDITALKKAEEALRDSEEKFRLVADFTSSWETWLDPKGDYIYVSPSCERITGHSAEDFIKNARLAIDIVHPDDRNAFENHQNIHYNRQAGFEKFDFRIVTPSGEVKWIGHLCRPVFGRNGEWLGCRISNRDITWRKQAEAALRETQDYLENLIDYANAPIIVWDTSFNVTRFNHAFEKLTGQKAEEILGKSLENLFPEESKEASVEHIRRTLSGDHWEVVEIPIKRTDGSVRIVLWNSATIYDKDGVAVAAIAQGQDITERKQAEEQLRKARDDLELKVLERTNELQSAKD